MIVRFINRNFCRKILDKNLDLLKMDFSSIELGSNTKLFVNENLTPYNQRLS